MSVGTGNMAAEKEDDIIQQINKAMLEFETGSKPEDMEIASLLPDAKSYAFNKYPPTAHKKLKTRITHEERGQKIPAKKVPGVVRLRKDESKKK